MTKGDLYKGGFERLVLKQEQRQQRFLGVDDILPAADIDLLPLFNETMPPPPMPHTEAQRYSARRKFLELQNEFQGKTRIEHLHALIISISRRENPPEAAVELFHRIWAEHGTLMAQTISVRWMISAATTFSDIGRTGDQRAGGMALSILFDMIKLHDSERRLSGRPGRSPYHPKAGRTLFPLAFRMPPYSFSQGDLDKIMLARIRCLCDRDPTLQPLGYAMLDMVMTDPRSIFGRLRTIRTGLKGR